MLVVVFTRKLRENRELIL